MDIIIEKDGFIITQKKKKPTVFTILDSKNYIVAETRMYDNDKDVTDLQNLLKQEPYTIGRPLGVKIDKYRIFVLAKPSINDRHVVIITLKRMAECFRQEVLDKENSGFEKYKEQNCIRISKSQEARELSAQALKDYESMEYKQSDDSWMMPLLIVVGIVIIIVGLVTNYLILIIIIPLIILAFTKEALGEKK